MRKLWRSKESNGIPARFLITSLYAITSVLYLTGMLLLVVVGNAHHKRVFWLEFGNYALKT